MTIVAPTAPCPITGQASRLVQPVSVKLIVSFWRLVGAGDLRRLYGDLTQVGLYASPCGLLFFHPMIASDTAFYEGVYRRAKGDRLLSHKPMQRAEYVRAASLVAEGQSVLDVGCGQGLFRRHLPHARYQGVDPFAPPDGPAWIARESLTSHADDHPLAYDLVCAFQVIEHVADPLGLVREMMRALKPGGRMVLCGPLYPSPLTEIPNNFVNGPPHHLTWWNAEAFEALCREAGLESPQIEALPPSPHQARVLWTHALLPVRARGGVCYSGSAPRNYGALAAYLLSGIAAPVFGLPPKARPVDVFMAARKP